MRFGKMLALPAKGDLDCKYVYNIGIRPWKDDSTSKDVSTFLGHSVVKFV